MSKKKESICEVACNCTSDLAMPCEICFVLDPLHCLKMFSFVALT